MPIRHGTVNCGRTWWVHNKSPSLISIGAYFIFTVDCPTVRFKISSSATATTVQRRLGRSECETDSYVHCRSVFVGYVVQMCQNSHLMHFNCTTIDVDLTDSRWSVGRPCCYWLYLWVSVFAGLVYGACSSQSYFYEPLLETTL